MGRILINSEALIKYAPYLIGQAHTQRVREHQRGHEWNQKVTVRTELVGGHVQRIHSYKF
jgi:hypothetical protein